MSMDMVITALLGMQAMQERDEGEDKRPGYRTHANGNHSYDADWISPDDPIPGCNNCRWGIGAGEEFEIKNNQWAHVKCPLGIGVDT